MIAAKTPTVCEETLVYLSAYRFEFQLRYASTCSWIVCSAEWVLFTLELQGKSVLLQAVLAKQDFHRLSVCREPHQAAVLEGAVEYT